MAEANTPMMQQYLKLKRQNPGCLLFFRLGDFYELFFEDAKLVSRELELTLTGRACGGEERAPMCGVPYHAVNTYIGRLIQKGYRVAIAEQMTDPALSKGLVEREIVRIVTPGTVLEDNLLNGDQNDYVACVCVLEGKAGLSYADISTGEFNICVFDEQNSAFQTIDELIRIGASEIITNEDAASLFDEITCEKLAARPGTSSECAADLQRGGSGARAAVRRFPCQRNDIVARRSGRRFRGHAFKLSGQDAARRAFANARRQSRALWCVYARRSGYAVRVGSAQKHARRPETISLLGILDRTSTSMGARLLRKWVERPLLSCQAIEARLDARRGVL